MRTQSPTNHGRHYHRTIKAAAEDCGLPRATVRLALNSLCRVIAKSLTDGQNYVQLGFGEGYLGRFELKLRTARTIGTRTVAVKGGGRRQMVINQKAAFYPKFIASKQFKKAIQDKIQP